MLSTASPRAMQSSLLHPVGATGTLVGGMGPEKSTLSHSTQGHNPQLHIPVWHWVEGAWLFPSASLMRRHSSAVSREKHQPHHCPPLDCGKPNLALSWGCGRHTATGVSCRLPAPPQPIPPKRHGGSSGGRAHQEMVLSAGKAFFFFHDFLFLLLLFFGGGRGIELGDFSKSIYYRGRNIHFLSNRKNFLDADKYHFPEG